MSPTSSGNDGGSHSRYSSAADDVCRLRDNIAQAGVVGMNASRGDLAVTVPEQAPQLSLPMIRALSAQWDLPADTLVRQYDLATIG